MAKWISLLSLSVFMLISAEAGAQTSYWDEKTELFKNDCQKTGKNCDLHEFSIKTFKSKVLFPDGAIAVGTTLIASYETESESSLKNYVLVQYIRGCRFESRLMRDGSIEKTNYYIKQNFDVRKSFHFPDWVIDSLDTDPAFGSNNGDRFYSYVKSAPHFDGAPASKFYASGKSRYPRLYISDAPTVVLFEPHGYAQNNSLEFKICIYRTADVPRGADETADIPAPIHCFNWASSHIFNHALKTFETKDGIDQFCERKIDNKIDTR